MAKKKSKKLKGITTDSLPSHSSIPEKVVEEKLSTSNIKDAVGHICQRCETHMELIKDSEKCKDWKCPNCGMNISIM